jgi:hypothetical protein
LQTASGLAAIANATTVSAGEAREIASTRARWRTSLWTLAFGYHEDRTPTHGYEPTREAAMAAFAKSWRRE